MERHELPISRISREFVPERFMSRRTNRISRNHRVRDALPAEPPATGDELDEIRENLAPSVEVGIGWPERRHVRVEGTSTPVSLSSQTYS